MTTQTITLEDAAKLQREHERAALALTEATERRNQAILFLLTHGGARQSDVARALDISPGRVSQLAERARQQQNEGVAAA